MVKSVGLSGSSHGGVGSAGGVARLSSASKCECTTSRTSEEEVALVLSGLVMLWRVEFALLGGERAAFNFQEAVGGFRASVVGRIGSCLYFPQYICGGGS
jgi:hypothetical protein